MDFVADVVANAPHKLDQFELPPDAREWVSTLIATLTQSAAAERIATLKNQALILELAHLRRMRFGAKSEALRAVHADLFDETLSADVSAIESEMAVAAAEAAASVATDQAAPRAAIKPKRIGAGRQALPAHLPRIEHRHDLADTGNGGACKCGACGKPLTVIGEDISEQLDVTPAQFFVHRHIRPQYACRGCETVTAAPVPAAVVDGGMAAPGLISWVFTSKFVDHLPLYRVEQIAARAEVPLPRSTLSAWVGRYGVALTPLTDRLRTLLLQRSVLHADETPVQQLDPGNGKTHRAYLWAYCTGELADESAPLTSSSTSLASVNTTAPPIVIFDYQTGRSGAYARTFLQGWRGHLMVDDYVGYKALFVPTPLTPQQESQQPSQQRPTQVIELGCMAHARRKFFELHAANSSPIALAALKRIAVLYEIERRGQVMSPGDRSALRHAEAAPALAAMKAWLLSTRPGVANGSALAKAIDYSLRRWERLSRYAASAHLPIDNNPIENAIRPIAIGKKNWLFAGSERAGRRAAAIQSLFATAKKNNIDPAAWLTDVLEKLPAWPNSRIDELLPLAGYRFGFG